MTGINIHSLSTDIALNICPNPTTDKIYLEQVKETEIEINLIDVHGRQMFATIKSNKLKTEINISDLNEGIYFLKIKTERGMITKKIIVQR